MVESSGGSVPDGTVEVAACASASSRKARSFFCQVVRCPSAGPGETVGGGGASGITCMTSSSTQF